MAQDATLHIKMTPDIIKNLRFLAKERNQTMGELIRQAVNSCYQLDFLKIGMVVKVGDYMGVVIGATNQYLNVFCIDKARSGIYHPTSKITYLDSKGNIIKEFI